MSLLLQMPAFFGLFKMHSMYYDTPGTIAYSVIWLFCSSRPTLECSYYIYKLFFDILEAVFSLLKKLLFFSQLFCRLI